MDIAWQYSNSAQDSRFVCTTSGVALSLHEDLIRGSMPPPPRHSDPSADIMLYLTNSYGLQGTHRCGGEINPFQPSANSIDKLKNFEYNFLSIINNINIIDNWWNSMTIDPGLNVESEKTLSYFEYDWE